jgi:ketosteroid isomerase-like protein
MDVNLTSDEAAITSLYEEWCAAFQAMDAEGMKSLFDADFPGLVYQCEESADPMFTWAEIAAYWDAAPTLVREVPVWRELTRKVAIDGDSAFIYSKLDTHLEVFGAKRPLIGELRALIGLRRVLEDWKIVHYHESRHVDLAFLFED